MPLPPGWTMGLVNGRVVPVPSEDYADTVGQPGGMGQGEYDAFIHSTGGQTNADMRQAYGGRGTPENIAAQRSITPAQATQGIGRLDPTSIAGPTGSPAFSPTPPPAFVNMGTGQYPPTGGQPPPTTMAPGLGPTTIPQGTQQDPNWWRAHNVPELMALSEASLQGLPMEALALLPNEIFVKYPSLMHRLDAATIQKRNFGADFLAQSGFGPKPALPPPTLPQLVGTGAVPPNVKKALTALTPGQTPGSPNYSPTAAYTRAGVRQPSMQTVRAMSPVDQQMLGATYSTVGLSPEDVAANVENYAGLSGGQQQSYSRVGAKPRVY